eukprot:3285767-Pyramimonas_sp.AAC.1
MDSASSFRADRGNEASPAHMFRLRLNQFTVVADAQRRLLRESCLVPRTAVLCRAFCWTSPDCTSSAVSRPEE